MAYNSGNGTWFGWARDLAFVAAIVGSAWVISNAIGDVRVEVARNTALIEGNAQAIERNAQAIERNAQAIERNAQAIERNADAIGEVKESVARLSGQYAEHIRKHSELAAR